MANASIVVLSGLPGSGKTKFAGDLMTAATRDVSVVSTDAGVVPPLKYRHICYDKLFPEGGESVLLGIEDGEPSKWKKYRHDITLCVKLLMMRKSNQSGSVFKEIAKTIPNDLLERFCKLVLEGESVTQFLRESDDQINIPDVTAEIATKISKETASPDVVLIVDDNMYYKSMRYEYYQMAREFNTGFCQVHIQCTKDVALERNRNRAESVPDHVILEMAEKMEIPDTMEGWQSKSVIITCSVDRLELNLRSVQEMIRSSFEDPVVDKSVEIDLEIREQSRCKCSKNILHQTDQVLRRAIGSYLKSLDKKRVNVREEAERANKLKALILKDMEKGLIIPDDDIICFVENAAKDSMNPYFVFVSKLFDEKLKA